MDLRDNRQETKLMIAYKERKKHSKGINGKKSWVLGMSFKKKLQNGRKEAKSILT